MTAQPPREFHDKPVSAAVGTPELDPPFTWRIVPGARPLDLHAPRVLRSTVPGDPGWLVVSGPLAGEIRYDEEVRDWPYTSDTSAGAAVILARRAPREGLVQPAERGDLDVESFKGATARPTDPTSQTRTTDHG